MEVQGKIKLVGNVQEITDSFRKRELVIVTQEQYPQTLCVEFVQDLSLIHISEPTRPY